MEHQGLRHFLQHHNTDLWRSVHHPHQQPAICYKETHTPSVGQDHRLSPEKHSYYLLLHNQNLYDKY